MKLFNKDKLPYWSLGLLFLLSLTYWIYLQFLPRHDTQLNYYFNVVIALFYCISGISSVLLSRTISTNNLKNIFIALGCGLIAWSFGNFFWSYYNIVLKAEIPYPSIADPFYLLFPVFIGWAFWLMLDLYKFRPTRLSMQISLIIVSIAYFVVFLMFSKPTIDGSTTVLTTVLNLAYPLTDAFLIALGLITFAAIGKISMGTILITIGLFCQAIGDLLFTYRQAEELYWNGDIPDLFYLLCAFAMAFGIYRLHTELQSKALSNGKQ